MSEFRRRLMMRKAQSDIPAGCVRCEYLESTGTQWIDTEKLVLSTEDIFIDFNPIIDDLGNYVYYGWRFDGTYTQDYQCYVNYYHASTNHIRLYYGVPAIATIAGMRVEHPTKLLISPTQRRITNNGVELTGTYDNTFSKAYRGGNSVVPPALCALNNIGSRSGFAKMKLYEYSLNAPDGNYTQRLLPILDQEGVPCMYDTVSKKFHYNKGTGQFLYKILQR